MPKLEEATEGPSEATDPQTLADVPESAPEAEDDPTESSDEAAETPTWDDLDAALGFQALDETEDRISILYYGREGTGKTTSAAFMANSPNARRVLVINAEAGVKQSALRRRGVDTSKIVVWPAQGTRITFDQMEKLHAKLLRDLREDPKSWTGIILDSATEIYAALREEATKSRQNRLDDQNRTYDPNFIDVADYGVVTDQLRRLFRRFRDLPCHVVITALERHDEETNTTGPELGPALAGSLMGYVDLVLYCRTDQQAAGEEGSATSPNAEFRALTRANSRYRAKDRFDATPRVLVDPSFVRVQDYVEGNIAEDDDILQQEYERKLGEQKEAKQAEQEQKAARRAAARKKSA